jgi:hypothetical protein
MAVPIDARNPRVLAIVYADVVGSKKLANREAFTRAMEGTASGLNDLFAPALVEPFVFACGDELQGSLGDPAQAPLCIAVMRETLAPIRLRVSVGIGTVDAVGGRGFDPYLAARRGLEALKKGRRLTTYAGTGVGGDVLLNAICRLVDPLLAKRTPKQWEAIAAYRRLGQQRAVAEVLGVTRQSVGDRLSAGNWQAVEDAGTAIAAYLAYVSTA